MQAPNHTHGPRGRAALFDLHEPWVTLCTPMSPERPLRDQHSALEAPPEGRSGGVLFEVGCALWGFTAGWLCIQALGVLAPSWVQGGFLYALSPIQLGIGGLVYAGIVRAMGPPVAALPVASLRGAPPTAPPGLARAGWLWLLHSAAAIGGSIALAFVLEALGLEVQEQAAVLEVVGDGRTWTSALMALSVGAVVLAPMAEEWMYRGLLFRRLHATTVPAVAWTVPAVLFALSHGNPSGMLVYIWLGLVFASAYRTTGRLWIAMGVHAANNLVTLGYLIAAARMGM